MKNLIVLLFSVLIFFLGAPATVEQKIIDFIHEEMVPLL